MAAVLTVMRQLHEMLVHLVEVARRSPDPAADVVRAQIEGLTGADPETLLLADVDALHERVGRLLSEASAAAYDGRGPPRRTARAPTSPADGSPATTAAGRSAARC